MEDSTLGGAIIQTYHVTVEHQANRADCILDILTHNMSKFELSKANTYTKLSLLFQMGNTQQNGRKLTKAIDRDNLQEVKKLVRKGVDLNKVIDNAGNTPLTLAIRLNQGQTVKFLLQERCEMESHNKLQFSALDTALLHYAKLGDEKYLDILRLLLEAGAETVSEDVVEIMFHFLQDHPRLLVRLCQVVAQESDKHHDILAILSRCLVQHSKIDCFSALLKYGADLQDIWPSSWIFKAHGGHEGVNDATFSFTSWSVNWREEHAECYNPHIARMLIQAANTTAALSNAMYIVLVYPLNTNNKIVVGNLIKFLALAGYQISHFLLTQLDKVHQDSIKWYHEFHSHPKKLQHLARLCIRTNMRTNIIYGAERLPLPRDLRSYVVIGDVTMY